MGKENKKIARNYVSALSDLMNKNLDSLQNAYELISLINASINKLPQAMSIFTSPTISAEEKKQILNKIIEASGLKKEKTLINLLNLLIDKKKFSLLSDIEVGLKAEIDSISGIVNAEIYSASKLTESSLEKLKKSLEKVFTSSGEKIGVENKIEPKLIAGVKVRINDLVYDGTIRGKLDSLKKSLK